jgi:hypothetical protein
MLCGCGVHQQGRTADKERHRAVQPAGAAAQHMVGSNEQDRPNLHPCAWGQRCAYCVLQLLLQR